MGKALKTRKGGAAIKPSRSSLIACALLLSAAMSACARGPVYSSPQNPASVRIVVGVDAAGKAHHRPADWPASAGKWNGKGARFHPEGQKLVFETYRNDIRGGSIVAPRGAIKLPGVNRYFVAGPNTGTADVEGTTVLYIANSDGSNPYCIGCTDARDGADGVRIYRATPSTTETAAALVRRPNAVIHANQNKDLAAWHPDGKWIIAAVEMPRHALTHHVGNSEIGMFNDLWAISVDGKTWVQLTDFAASWSHVDAVATMPAQCADKPNCPLGCQYSTSENRHPFSAYACSDAKKPPPSLGAMRPTVGNRVHKSRRVRVSWAERVGINPRYTWAGPLQLAVADLVLVNNLPVLINYQRNLTPTPRHPDGRGLWRNPTGRGPIGAGYESWTFSPDDACLGVATDVFLSTSNPSVKRRISRSSQAFVDVALWCRDPAPRLINITAYERVVYAYRPNGLRGKLKHYGHWEEPVAFASDGKGGEYIAFGSSADLDPPWNPLKHNDTMGLDTWLVRADRRKPAVRLTYFNDRSTRMLAYPTAFNPRTNRLYLTVVPGGMGGLNPPGSVYELPLPAH